MHRKLSFIIALFICTTQLASAALKVSHTPIPIGIKGKAIDIEAQVTGASDGIKSVTLRYTAGKDGKPLSATMKPKDGKWIASISAKTTKSADIVTYTITATDKSGNTDATIPCPVKLEDPNKKKDEKKADKKTDAPEKKSLTRKAINYSKEHPYITGGGAAVVVGAALAGGGSGGSHDNASDSGTSGILSIDPVTGNVIGLCGTWNGSDGETFSMTLSQTDATFTGTMTTPDGPATVSGSVSGTFITMTVYYTDTGVTDSWTGNVNVSANSMTGNWSSDEGDSGTWSASR